MHKNVATVSPDPLLTFEPLAMPPGVDTLRLVVRIARTSRIIGAIAWASPFRQYAFEAAADGIYTRSVLQAVNRKLHRLMYDWRKDHPEARRGLPGLSQRQRRDMARAAVQS